MFSICFTSPLFHLHMYPRMPRDKGSNFRLRPVGFWLTRYTTPFPLLPTPLPLPCPQTSPSLLHSLLAFVLMLPVWWVYSQSAVLQIGLLSNSFNYSNLISPRERKREWEIVFVWAAVGIPSGVPQLSTYAIISSCTARTVQVYHSTTTG
jgi:hypothetical protein